MRKIEKTDLGVGPPSSLGASVWPGSSSPGQASSTRPPNEYVLFPREPTFNGVETDFLTLSQKLNRLNISLFTPCLRTSPSLLLPAVVTLTFPHRPNPLLLPASSALRPFPVFSKVAFSLNPQKIKEMWIVPLGFVVVTGTSMGVAWGLGTVCRLKKSQKSVPSVLSSRTEPGRWQRLTSMFFFVCVLCFAGRSPWPLPAS